MQRIATFLRNHERTAERLVLAIAGTGAAAAVFRLASLMLFQGIADVTDRIYWVMGRAILNGLVPYEDIFETKPPGMFIVSTLSHALFGNGLLGNILHITLLVLLPLLFVHHAWRASAGAPRMHRWLVTSFAFLGVAALLRYLLPHPGPWSPDFFGACLGVLYILVIAGDKPMTKGKTTLATLALFAAIGIKEPFFLATLAGAIVLLRTRREFLRGWMLPACFAGGLGVMALALLGWLDGYTGVYLPSMFGGYIQRLAVPLWQRGAAVDMVFQNLATLSPAFPLFILSLFGFALFRGRRTAAEHRAITITLLFALTFVFILSLTRPPLTLLLAQGSLVGIVLLTGFSLSGHRRGDAWLPFGILLITALALFVASSFQCVPFSAVHLPSLLHEGAMSSCAMVFALLGGLVLSSLFITARSHGPEETRALLLASAILMTAVFCLELIAWVGTSFVFYGDLSLRRFLWSTILPPSIALAMGTMHITRRWTMEQRGMGLRTGMLCLAFVLAITAVGLGGDFQNQHYLAAAPFYAALLLGAINMLSAKHEYGGHRLFLWGCTILAVIITFSPSSSSKLSLRAYRENLAETQRMLARAQESASALDAILDRCEVDRYYLLANTATFNPLEGFTRHSPLNFFLWAGIEGADGYAPPVRTREVRNLFQAQIVVAPVVPRPTERKWDEQLQSYLQDEFTEQPWPCAEGLPEIPERTLLYRKVSGSTTPMSAAQLE